MSEASERLTVAMIVANSCINDSRVRKEAFSIAAAGYAVTVVCDNEGGALEDEVVNGVHFRRINLAGRARRRRSPGPKTARGRPRAQWRARLVTWVDQLSCGSLSAGLRMRMSDKVTRAGAAALAALRPAIIHAHDLETLGAAVAATNVRRAVIVYDAHELEGDRHGMRWVERYFARACERRYIHAAARVITVSGSIAKKLAERYGIEMPLVVLNAPDVTAREEPCQSVRAALGLAPSDLLMIYIGKLSRHRGLELAVDALDHLAGVHLACVGPVAKAYLGILGGRVAERGSTARFHYLPPVPPEQVIDFVASADCALVLTEDAGLSYRYSLPNKLFEACFAGLAVGVSDLPEQRKFVEATGIGMVLDTGSPAALAKSISHLLECRAALRPDQEKLESLAREYAWAAQAEKLVAAYRALPVMAP